MTDITPTPTPAPAPGFGDAVAVRQNAVTARAEAERATRALRSRQEAAKADLERKKTELEAEFRRQTAALEEQMRPLAEHLDRLRETLWTADLYLGRDEDIFLLRDGEPAPADTPITIRQKVLVMAEESLVLIGKSNLHGMDATNVQEFINWLVATPENLDRVLPDPKGVVVLVPTRVDDDSRDALTRAALDEINRRAHWVIRNGDRVHMFTTDPELKVGDRILPLRDEFTSVFERRLFGFDRAPGEHVKPGSEEWLALEKKADSKRRHYMRLMLVLQGILDRTTLLHPLPGGTVNLMNVAAQDNGQVRLIQDGDTAFQLTDGRESFAAWQARLNGRLRPGLRVVANFMSKGFRDQGELDWNGRRDPDRNTRLTPTKASTPTSGVPYLLEGRRDGGWFFRYERTDEVYRSDVPVPDKPGYVYRGLTPTAPSRRASCVIKAEDTWVLPFDLATVADMEYYLNHRGERGAHFLSMVPILRAALEAKVAEKEAENPFRRLLGDMLAQEGAEPADVPALLDELVHWWKTRNLYARALNGEPEHEARAAREIVAEYRARQEAAADPVADAMVAVGRRVPGAVAVTRDRQGRWAVYSASPDAHDNGVFLDVTPLRRNGKTGTVKKNQTITWRARTSLHTAWSTPAWDTWGTDQNPHHYLTQDERQEVIDRVLADTTDTPMAVVEYFDPKNPTLRLVGLYAWHGEDTPEDTDLAQKEGSFVTVRRYQVTKDDDGVHLGTADHPWGARKRLRDDFDGYSAHDLGLNGLPWWPDTAHQYTDVRPRRIWVDPDVLASLGRRRAKVKALWDATQAEKSRRDQRARERADAVCADLDAVWVDQVRARFLEDYGTGAEDLWEGHLKATPRPKDMPTPQQVWNLLKAAEEHGKGRAAMTLGQVVDLVGGQVWPPVGDIGEPWASVTVPASAEKE